MALVGGRRLGGAPSSTWRWCGSARPRTARARRRRGGAAGGGAARLRGRRLRAHRRAAGAAAAAHRGAGRQPRPARRVPRHAVRGGLPRRRRRARPAASWPSAWPAAPITSGAAALRETSAPWGAALACRLRLVLVALLLVAACASPLRPIGPLSDPRSRSRCCRSTTSTRWIPWTRAGAAASPGWPRWSSASAARIPATLFALGGDVISPSVASTLLRGEQMIAGLNAIGLDLATFGNHEFDFGPAVLSDAHARVGVHVALGQRARSALRAAVRWRSAPTSS